MALLIISLLLIAIGIVSWYFDFKPFIGYSVGLVLGISLMICLLKKLSQWATKSLISWTLLTSILSFKITSHLAKNHGYDVKEEAQSTYDNDDKDIKIALKKYGYFPTEVKEAIAYLKEYPVDGTLEEKVIAALKYLGNGHKALKVGGKG